MVRKMREVCRLGDGAEALLAKAVDRMSLSGRAHDRVLKVARTVADLAGAKDIDTEHLAEALNYRMAGSVGR